MRVFVLLLLLVGCVHEPRVVSVRFDWGEVRRDCGYVETVDEDGSVVLRKHGFDAYDVLPEKVVIRR